MPLARPRQHRVNRPVILWSAAAKGWNFWWAANSEVSLPRQGGSWGHGVGDSQAPRYLHLPFPLEGTCPPPGARPRARPQAVLVNNFFENARKALKAARFVLFEKTRETEQKTERRGTFSLELKDARSRPRDHEPRVQLLLLEPPWPVDWDRAHERPALLRHLRHRFPSSRTERSLKGG